MPRDGCVERVQRHAVAGLAVDAESNWGAGWTPRSKLTLAALGVVSKLTGSLKPTTMEPVGLTLLAPLAGAMDITLGAASTEKLQGLPPSCRAGPAVGASCTAAASTVAVQAAPPGSVESGAKLTLVIAVAGSAGVDGGNGTTAVVNAPASRFTDSLKLTLRLGSC